MPKRKLPKDMEIIEPGAVAQFIGQVKTFVLGHSTQVIAVSLIILVAGAGIGLWAYSKARADRQSLTQFYTALQNYKNINESAEKKDAPASKEDAYKKALEQFTAVITQYPDSRGGIAALFYAGSCSYYLNKDEDALKQYQDFLNKTGQRADTLKPFAYEGMGYVYERKKDYKKAIELYEKQQAGTQSSLAITAPLNIARCYAALGDTANACTAYQEFIKKYPSAPMAETAKLGEAEFCQKTVK